MADDTLPDSYKAYLASQGGGTATATPPAPTDTLPDSYKQFLGTQPKSYQEYLGQQNPAVAKELWRQFHAANYQAEQTNAPRPWPPNVPDPDTKAPSAAPTEKPGLLSRTWSAVKGFGESFVPTPDDIAKAGGNPIGASYVAATRALSPIVTAPVDAAGTLASGANARLAAVGQLGDQNPEVRKTAYPVATKPMTDEEKRAQLTMAGTVLPMLAGPAVGAISNPLLKGAAKVATGAATGALFNPEDPAVGAVLGGAPVAALEGLGAGLSRAAAKADIVKQAAEAGLGTEPLSGEDALKASGGVTDRIRTPAEWAAEEERRNPAPAAVPYTGPERRGPLTSEEIGAAMDRGNPPPAAEAPAAPAGPTSADLFKRWQAGEKNPAANEAMARRWLPGARPEPVTPEPGPTMPPEVTAAPEPVTAEPTPEAETQKPQPPPINPRTQAAPAGTADVQAETFAKAPAKTRMTFGEQKAAFQQFADENGISRLDLDPKSVVNPYTGPQIMAMREQMNTNWAQAAEIDKRLAEGTLPADQSEALEATRGQLMAKNDELLRGVVRETAAAGRNLGYLNQLAAHSLDPDVWAVNAQRLAGDVRIPDETIAEIRRLAQIARDICGGG